MIAVATRRTIVTRFEDCAILCAPVRHLPDTFCRGTYMAQVRRDEDRELVAACLSGTEPAWTEFYCRFFKVVRHTVRRQRFLAHQDVEDVTQLVFLSLIAGLRTYDHSYSLSRFVVLVAERVSVGEYRKRRTLKRDAITEPIEHHDYDPHSRMIPSEANDPEKELSLAEDGNMLKLAFRGLRDRCRELLHLRYYEEQSYKEMAELLDASENTLTVRVRRCLDELRNLYQEMGGKVAS
jgi:RNA polymerase sigma factor (sigma-70 family)